MQFIVTVLPDDILQGIYMMAKILLFCFLLFLTSPKKYLKNTVTTGEIFIFFVFHFLEAIPGNIRKAEHFVGFMRRFIEYLKVK